MQRIILGCVLAALLILPSACGVEDVNLTDLQEGATYRGFVLRCLYEDGAGRVMGARLVSEKHGFLVDLLQIQSVPQGFMWVKTPPWSDRGEAHACEHLLLGKGGRGRHVANLENMTLGDSSAWTSQLNTVYHFNTLAGEEAYYSTLEARLNALLNPDFSDEEIRREVCHVGVTENPSDGKLFLEEKGTVYTEMVSAYEGPGYPLWRGILSMLYGNEHPESNASGGDPDVMREMTPEHMWEFHEQFYHPGNMGLIASIPSGMSVGKFLDRLGDTLDEVFPKGDVNANEGIRAVELPAPAPLAGEGEIRLLPYQSDSKEQRGQLSFAWPADLELSGRDKILLSLFFSAFSRGPGSQLYDAFINSETRLLDLGLISVGGYEANKQGSPIFFDFDGLLSEHVTVRQVRELRELLIAEIGNLHDLPADSEILADFNRRVGSRLESLRKQSRDALNKPPMFGFRRGSAGYWQRLLGQLEEIGGFRRSLVLEDEFGAMDSLLVGEGNIWHDLIDDWRLLQRSPVAVAVYPSPEMMDTIEAAKQTRLAGYLADYRLRYGETDDQAALAAYKADFDAMTAELEAAAAGDRMPGFVDSPPMTLDDQLDYELIKLPGNVELCASTFDNMNSATLGLALNLDALPASHLHLVPLLPSLLTGVGVIKDGAGVDYVEMREKLQREVTSYNAYFSSNAQTGRVELVLRGSGAGSEEMSALLGWMKASLGSPLLSPENLPRLRDVVDQALVNARGRMQGTPEAWVGDPTAAWREQDNRLFLAAESFLTQTHFYHRLSWLLREPQNDESARILGALLDDLRAKGEGLDREGLGVLLTAIEPSDVCGDLSCELVNALRLSLPEIPDFNLQEDWDYLCRQIKRDLFTPPAETLVLLEESLALIRRSAGARLFMISSREARESSLRGIADLCALLSPEPVASGGLSREESIFLRLREREGLTARPHYVGLVNEGTRNGVLVFRARNREPWDPSDDSVLDALSGRLYGGGGAHGLFMRTWAAGLAYSNGYGYREGVGTTSYYAERCPDVAQTMRFVVDVLEDVKLSEELRDYAVAGLFNARSAGPYENRGEALAADLADGLSPERVRAFREKVLELRRRPDLLAELERRMPEVYGQVLIGFGPSLAQSAEGSFMLIGPEPQFVSLEEYIASVEEEQRIARIYPRDYWLVN